MKRPFFNKRIKAFSLVELLVVLGVIGILVLMAIPVLEPLISKAHGTEAKLQLKHLHTLQKAFFLERSKFSADMEAIGYEQPKLVSEGGNAKFAIEIIESDVTSFRARATAAVDFDGDGTFNVWEVDQDMNLEEVVRD